MKKLVLLVSVFLLVAGMVAADVTFAPAVTGTTSVTWGLDLETVSPKVMNSGFDTATATSLDLGVTVDPVDAKGGEGIYGEVTMSGLAVTAKSGSEVTVAAPSIDAKLWFSEALYGYLVTSAVLFDYASPLGNLVTVDDNKEEGTWYDKDDDYMGTVLKFKDGNAGYGATYMAGDLTVNLAFVSDSAWGKSNETKTFDPTTDANKAAWGVLIETSDYVIMDETGYTAFFSAVAAINGALYEDTYTARGEVVDYDNNPVTNEYKVTINGDDEAELVEIEPDKDVNYVFAATKKETTAKNSLYTFGVDVAYTLTDVGTFKAYVAPTNANHKDNFTKVSFGAEAAIALASFDMVGLTVAADFLYDNSISTVADERFEYEVEVTVPVKVGDLLAANFKAATTNHVAAENKPVDLYADATLTVAGATVKGAYQVANFGAMYGKMDQMYEISANYPVAVGEGLITPSVTWEHDMQCPTDGVASHEVYLTVAAPAAIVDNVTFTPSWKSGDLFVPANDGPDMGVFTFKTEFAY